MGNTSDQIKTLIQEVLTKFEIKRSQLLAVVCDNAANMSKTVRLLNEDGKDSEDELEMNSEDEDSEEMADIKETMTKLITLKITKNQWKKKYTTCIVRPTPSS